MCGRGMGRVMVLGVRMLLIAAAVALVLPGGAAGQGSLISLKVEPEGNSLKGRALDVQPTVVVTMPNGLVDVLNTGSVTASLGLNPTASQLGGLEAIACVLPSSKRCDMLHLSL